MLVIKAKNVPSHKLVCKYMCVYVVLAVNLHLIHTRAHVRIYVQFIKATQVAHMRLMHKAE